MNDVIVSIVNFSDKAADIVMVRQAVFIEEQNVPADIEMDGNDQYCHHVLAYDNNGSAIGTGRIDDKGKIGRMAVLPNHRGLGVGTKILQALITCGRDKGITDFHLSSQVHAVAFYEKAGFVKCGEEFEEAGIMHVNMTYVEPSQKRGK